jgi:hypothetical protein
MKILRFDNLNESSEDSVRKNFICVDCGKDTWKDDKDYYMIKNDMWDKYGVGEKMLCMKCIETRLGHKLTRADITDCPLNRMNYYTSKLFDNEQATNENFNYEDRIKNAPDDKTLRKSIAENEMETAYRWIFRFGGDDLLANKGIWTGNRLLTALVDNDITIEEIDNATRGSHGQAGDIAFSQTPLYRELLIPYIKDLKLKKSSETYNL